MKAKHDMSIGMPLHEFEAPVQLGWWSRTTTRTTTTIMVGGTLGGRQKTAVQEVASYIAVRLSITCSRIPPFHYSGLILLCEPQRLLSRGVYPSLSVM